MRFDLGRGNPMKVSYSVSVRGPVPPDLAERLAQAHAAAVVAAQKPQREAKPAGARS